MGKLKFVTVCAAAFLALTFANPSQAQLFGRKKDDSNVRLNEMEERLRSLTGNIEQLSHQMRELQDQLRRMQEDNEYRFQQLEGGEPQKRGDAGQPEPKVGELGTPPQTLGTLPAEGSGDAEWAASGGYEKDTTGVPGNGPIDLSVLAGGNNLDAGGGNVPPAGQPMDGDTPPSNDSLAGLIKSSGDPRTDYDQAYNYAINGEYPAAEDAFRAFLETYPDDRLTSNAQYWLGESLLAQKKYRDAADAFLKTYTDHPGSDKSPDSLLKLGIALFGLGEKDAGCATFSELLTKYPNAAPAVLDQAREERRRGKCS